MCGNYNIDLLNVEENDYIYFLNNIMGFHPQISFPTLLGNISHTLIIIL